MLNESNKFYFDDDATIFFTLSKLPSLSEPPGPARSLQSSFV